MFCTPDHIYCALRDFKTLDSGAIVPDLEIAVLEKTLQVSVTPVTKMYSSEVVAISVSLTDITPLRLMERKLERLNGELLTANTQLSRHAETDHLTGLANRFAFENILRRELDRSSRSQNSLAVILIDVDHFKKYNDRYGHLAGDRCLSTVAEGINASIRRPSDCAARFGGEEFVVILPETDLSGAAHVAEAIRSHIERLGIPHEDSSHGCVTVSLGISYVCPRDTKRAVHEVRDELLSSADTSLYAAKHAGRNSFQCSAQKLTA